MRSWSMYCPKFHSMAENFLLAGVSALLTRSSESCREFGRCFGAKRGGPQSILVCLAGTRREKGTNDWPSLGRPRLLQLPSTALDRNETIRPS